MCAWHALRSAACMPKMPVHVRVCTLVVVFGRELPCHMMHCCYVFWALKRGLLAGHHACTLWHGMWHVWHAAWHAWHVLPDGCSKILLPKASPLHSTALKSACSPHSDGASRECGSIAFAPSLQAHQLSSPRHIKHVRLFCAALGCALTAVQNILELPVATSLTQHH